MSLESDGAVELIDRSIEDPLRELGGEALLCRLWRLFLEVAPERMERLERLAAEGDSAGVAELAHLVRSTALSLGATELARRAASIERSNGDLAAQRAELVGFVDASDRLGRHLSARLAEADSRGGAASDPGPAAPDQSNRPTKL